MIIKNRDEVSTTKLRERALDIIEAGISRVLPSRIMEAVLEYDLVRKVLIVEGNAYDISKGRIFVIGGGKAASFMAETLENILGPENITAGVVNCKDSDYKTKKIKIITAGHPFPDKEGAEGVKKMLALKDKYSINEDDLIICLISGGASALMPCPVDEVSLEDKQKATKLLLSRGAEIQEINAVRKHLSKTKGGRLGSFFSPTVLVSLIISDVVGNKLDVIASAPTHPDSSTFSDALNVLEKYNLLSEVPKSIVSFLKKGCKGKAKETPKKLDNCRSYIIGDNKLALDAMAEKAGEMGLKPYIVTAEQKGDPNEAAFLRANEILKGKYKEYDVILIGGETTPKLPDNSGKGGRNQHYAALSMLALEKYSGQWAAASIGTDGSDFMSDVAGAIVDNNSLAVAEDKKINIKEHLVRFDSNTLLKKIGNSLIITGNTGTNVCDIMVYILK